MATEERFQSDLNLAPGTRLPSLTHGCGRRISLRPTRTRLLVFALQAGRL